VKFFSGPRVIGIPRGISLRPDYTSIRDQSLKQITSAPKGKRRIRQRQRREAKVSEGKLPCAINDKADFRCIFASIKGVKNNDLLQVNIYFSIKEN
jgi:hypothetical protein